MLEPYTSGSMGAAKNDNSGLAGLEIYLGTSKGRRSRHRTLYFIFRLFTGIAAPKTASFKAYRHLYHEMMAPTAANYKVYNWHSLRPHYWIPTASNRQSPLGSS